jgi:hypothetical protein
MACLHGSYIENQNDKIVDCKIKMRLYNGMSHDGMYIVN